MLGILDVSRLMRRVEMLVRRRLMNAVVEGLLIAVLTVVCAVAAAIETSLMDCVCFSNVSATWSITLMMLSVVPERAMLRMLVFWSARS